MGRRFPLDGEHAVHPFSKQKLMQPPRIRGTDGREQRDLCPLTRSGNGLIEPLAAEFRMEIRGMDGFTAAVKVRHTHEHRVSRQANDRQPTSPSVCHSLLTLPK